MENLNFEDLEKIRKEKERLNTLRCKRVPFEGVFFGAMIDLNRKILWSTVVKSWLFRKMKIFNLVRRVDDWLLRCYHRRFLQSNKLIKYALERRGYHSLMWNGNAKRRCETCHEIF